jgi:hypothetical protein
MVFEFGAVNLGSFVACRTLKCRVEAVAAVVDGPDRETVGYRAGACR